METLIETFLNHIRKDIVQNKIKSFHLQEKLANIRDIPEVALGRFVSHLFNTNGDDWLTVFELNGNTEKYGRDGDVIKFTFEKIRELEKLFCSKIEFLPLDLQKMEEYQKQRAENESTAIEGGDGTSYNIQDLLARNVSKHAGTLLHTNDMVLTVQPFQRIAILCKVPRFNRNMYPHDCISILRYEGVTDLKQLHTATTSEFTFKEIDNCRSYLSESSNMEFYRRDVFAWNAPEILQRNKQQKVEIVVDDIVTLGQNFHERKIGIDVVRDYDVAPGTNREPKPMNRADQFLDDHGVSSMCTMLYTPIMRKPGFYTVRLALDDLKIDTNDDVQSTVFKKKRMISNKNYYYNRSVEERDLFTSVRGSMIMASIEGLGMSNFKQYIALILQLYDLDIEEQVVAIRHNTYSSEDSNQSHAYSDNRDRYETINAIRKEKHKFINSNQMKVKDYLFKKGSIDGNLPATKASDNLKQNDVQSGGSTPVTPTTPVESENCPQPAKNALQNELIIIKALLLMKGGKKNDNVENDEGDDEDTYDDTDKGFLASQRKNRTLKPSQVKLNFRNISSDQSIEYIESNGDEEIPSESNPMVSQIRYGAIFNLADQLQRHIMNHELFEPPAKGHAENVPLPKLPYQKQLSVADDVFQLVKDPSSGVHLNPHSCIHQSRKILGTIPMNLFYQYAHQVKLVIGEYSKNGLTNPAVDKEIEHQINYKSLILHKINILFNWTKLIIQAEEFIRSSVKAWRDRLPFTSSLMLQQIESSLKEYKGLVAEHRVLIETILKMIHSSPPHLLTHPSRTALLISFDNDRSTSLAMVSRQLSCINYIIHDFPFIGCFIV